MRELARVLAAFGIPSDASARGLSGGKINTTWLVEDRGKRYILQRVNPVFRPGMIDDCAYVLDRLHNDGWDVPVILPTSSGEFYYSDDGSWRLSTFIESDEKLPMITPTLLEACGGLLARLHLSLGKIQRVLPAPLPHYRDAALHIGYLKDVLHDLSGDARTLAEQTIGAFNDQDSRDEAGVAPQLIHGDPKLNNMLFRNGQPYTYIDWDTVMTGSPLIDLGDFARSLTKESQHEDVSALLSSFCRGYYTISDLGFSNFDEFVSAILSAAKVIALENTARYLYDIIDQSLWEWDETKYSSQEQAMLAEARKSWQAFESLNQ